MGRHPRAQRHSPPPRLVNRTRSPHARRPAPEGGAVACAGVGAAALACVVVNVLLERTRRAGFLAKALLVREMKAAQLADSILNHTLKAVALPAPGRGHPTGQSLWGAWLGGMSVHKFSSRQHCCRLSSLGFLVSSKACTVSGVPHKPPTSATSEGVGKSGVTSSKEEAVCGCGEVATNSPRQRPVAVIAGDVNPAFPLHPPTPLGQAGRPPTPWRTWPAPSSWCGPGWRRTRRWRTAWPASAAGCGAARRGRCT